MDDRAYCPLGWQLHRPSNVCTPAVLRDVLSQAGDVSIGRPSLGRPAVVQIIGVQGVRQQSQCPIGRPAVVQTE